MSKTIRQVAIVIALIIFLFCSWRTWTLYQQEELWGHLPLFQFGSLWTLIVLLWYPRFSKMTNKDQLLGLSVASGFLLTLSFPPLPTTFFIFFAFIPLLYVEHQISDAISGTAKWEVFKYSYVTFVIWNILTTFWVANTAFVAGVFAMFLNAAFMTFPFVLFHVTKNQLNKKLGYAAFIAYWLSFEYIYLNQELSWTWLNIGNAFAQFPSWIQWYEYTGVFGGALWALVANVLGLELVYQYKKEQQINKWSISKLAVWIFVPLLASLVIYFNHTDKGESTKVVIVQPNLEPHHVKFQMSHRAIMERFVKLSEESLTEDTDYLVFPETSFGRIDITDPLSNQTISTLKKMVDQYPDLKLVTGIAGMKIFGPNEVHGPSVRTHQRGNETIYWESYNAAIQLEAGKEEVPVYIKSKLVPGGEFLPYRKIFFWLEPLVDKLGGSMAGLGRQAERSVFVTANDGTAIAPVICYESIYGAYTTEYIRKGAKAIFIVTNDGWWDNTAGHRQHLAYASLRAIETRRSIARSANTGISAFINQRGDILQATHYDQPIAIIGDIQLNDEITIYVTWGDLIARVAGFLAILLLLNGFVKGRIK